MLEQVVIAILLHQLLVLKQKSPVIEVHVVLPHLQFVLFTLNAFKLLQLARAALLHQLSELKQKSPVEDVQVLFPHMQTLVLTTDPEKLVHADNAEL